MPAQKFTYRGIRLINGLPNGKASRSQESVMPSWELRTRVASEIGSRAINSAHIRNSVLLVFSQAVAPRSEVILYCSSGVRNPQQSHRLARAADKDVECFVMAQ